MHLRCCRRGPLGAHMPFLLNQGLVGWIHVQSMLHYRRVNAGHVLGTEGKDVPILLQEVN